VAVFSAFTADNSKGILKVMEVLRARNMLGDSKHNESLLHMAVNGNYKHPEVQKNLVKYLLRIGAAPTRVNSGMVRDPEIGRLIDAAKRRNLIKKR
jgi:hypothetical protein